MPRTGFRGLNLFLVAVLIAAPLSVLFTNIARAEEKKKKTELDKKMEVIDEGMKKLKRTLKKSDQNEASLKILAKVIEASNECKELCPAKAEKMPEAEKAKFIEGYRKAMATVIDTLEQMQKALQAGDNAKAIELQKSLKEQKEDGHDKYMDSDDKEAAGKDKDKDK